MICFFEWIRLKRLGVERETSYLKRIIAKRRKQSPVGWYFDSVQQN